jgi:LacI family transcriptional regulator
MNHRGRPTVALLVETSRSYGRGLCAGIAAYARAHDEWNFVIQERDLRGGIPEWLPRWRGDGILCRLSDQKLADVLASAPCPVIDLYGQIRHERIPFLDTDADAVAAMAVRFFMDAAFTKFAYCGFPGLWFSDERGSAFERQLRQFGMDVDFYRPDRVGSLDVAERESLHPAGSRELEAWVASLPEQTAVLACNDVRAQQLLMVANRIGRLVPDDLAVMGVDDDEVICALASPLLTSIQPDTYRLGYTAAYWLDLLMQGKPLKSSSLVIPPLAVHERASTDVIASDDPLFVEAMRFIRSHVQTGIDVNSVARRVACSRRTLTERFRQLLGRSVKEEITRQRLLRARQLLQQTSLTIDRIAEDCGFATASHFSRVFKEQEGKTPGDFRALASILPILTSAHHPRVPARGDV